MKFTNFLRNAPMIIAVLIAFLFFPGFASAQTAISCTSVGRTSTACGNGDPTIAYNDADGTVRTRAITAAAFGVANGYGAQATGRGDVAVGSYAYTGVAAPPASPDGDSYRTAIGYDAQATGYLSSALGAFNHATGTGSVVLGYGSNDDGQAYVVSVGGKDDNGNYITRRVTNVADGVDAHDAATVGQLNSQQASTNAQFAIVNSQYNTLSSLPVSDVNAAQVVAGDAATLASANSHADAGDAATLSRANAYTDQSVNGVKDWVNSQNRVTLQKANSFAAKGVAQALAIPTVPFLAPGQKWIGAAVGSFAGERAVGIAAGYQVNESVNLGAGVSRDVSTSDHLAFRVQGGYAW